MADTEATKTVESTVEEKKVEEKEKLTEKDVKEDTKVVEENGDSKDAKNGDSTEETEKQDEEKEEPVTEKCSIKRKSAGGDAVDGAKDESTPEKKAKVDAAAVAEEANGEVTEAEAAA